MTETLIDYAEEQFLKKNYAKAYHTTKLAKQLDPFFGSVDKYEAAFRVHYAAYLCKDKYTGEPDWYEVLGLDRSASTRDITHRFCRMGKLVDPSGHCSAAAERAYELATKAFEVLGDPESRMAFEKRWNSKPVNKEKENAVQGGSNKRCTEMEATKIVGGMRYHPYNAVVTRRMVV